MRTLLFSMLLACGEKEEEWIDGEWFDKGIYSGTITSENTSYPVTFEVHDSGRNVDVTMTIDIAYDKYPEEELLDLFINSQSIFNTVCSVIDSEVDSWNFSCNEFSNISANGVGTWTVFDDGAVNSFNIQHDSNMETNVPYEYSITSCEGDISIDSDNCFEPIELTGKGFKEGFFISSTFIANPSYEDSTIEYSLRIGN